MLRDVSGRLAAAGRPMAHNTVSEIERGARRVDVDDLMALAAALDVSPIALLSDSPTFTADLSAVVSDLVGRVNELKVAVEATAGGWSTVATIESYDTAAGRRYQVRYRTPQRTQTKRRGFQRGRRMYKTKPAGLTLSDIADLLAKLGWIYTKMASGVHLNADEFTPDAPVMIVRISGHMCAVVDGTVRDTWDCGQPHRPGSRHEGRYRLVRGIYLPGDTATCAIVAPGPVQPVAAEAVEPVVPVVTVEPPDVDFVAVSTTTSYRDAATALWGEAGAYVHDAYNRWLPRFPELPDELPIVIGITAYGRCIGLTRAGWQHGPRITIASNLFKAGRRAVDDTMVHEMLHAWLYVTGQSAPAHKSDHDTEAWYAAIRRLSPAVLGHDLDVRRGAARKSVRVKLDDGSSVVRKVANPDYTGPTHDMVARWPHPFRPEDYDCGEPIDCPTY